MVSLSRAQHMVRWGCIRVVAQSDLGHDPHAARTGAAAPPLSKSFPNTPHAFSAVRTPLELLFCPIKLLMYAKHPLLLRVLESRARVAHMAPYERGISIRSQATYHLPGDGNLSRMLG